MSHSCLALRNFNIGALKNHQKLAGKQRLCNAARDKNEVHGIKNEVHAIKTSKKFYKLVISKEMGTETFGIRSLCQKVSNCQQKRQKEEASTLNVEINQM